MPLIKTAWTISLVAAATLLSQPAGAAIAPHATGSLELGLGDVIDKAADGIKKGSKKAEKGIKKGAKKTEKGVKKGAKHARKGVDKAADKTKDAVK